MIPDARHFDKKIRLVKQDRASNSIVYCVLALKSGAGKMSSISEDQLAAQAKRFLCF